MVGVLVRLPLENELQNVKNEPVSLGLYVVMLRLLRVTRLPRS